MTGSGLAGQARSPDSAPVAVTTTSTLGDASVTRPGDRRMFMIFLDPSKIGPGDARVHTVRPQQPTRVERLVVGRHLTDDWVVDEIAVGRQVILADPVPARMFSPRAAESFGDQATAGAATDLRVTTSNLGVAAATFDCYVICSYPDGVERMLPSRRREVRFRRLSDLRPLDDLAGTYVGKFCGASEVVERWTAHQWRLRQPDGAEVALTCADHAVAADLDDRLRGAAGCEVAIRRHHTPDGPADASILAPRDRDRDRDREPTLGVALWLVDVRTGRWVPVCDAAIAVMTDDELARWLQLELRHDHAPGRAYVAASGACPICERHASVELMCLSLASFRNVGGASGYGRPGAEIGETARAWQQIAEVTEVLRATGSGPGVVRWDLGTDRAIWRVDVVLLGAAAGRDRLVIGEIGRPCVVFRLDGRDLAAPAASAPSTLSVWCRTSLGDLNSGDVVASAYTRGAPARGRVLEVEIASWASAVVEVQAVVSRGRGEVTR